MPFVNGRFYANPIFGRALERARAANDGRVWSEDSPHTEPIAAQTHSAPVPAPHHHESGHRVHHRDDHDAATTQQGVASQIYNETAGLRVTRKSGIGPGTDWNMQQARTSIAHVIQNRAATKMRGGLASDQLSADSVKAIKTIASPAYDAHGGAVAAAHEASRHPDPTHGAQYFYLDYGQPPPGWSRGKELVGDYGPFRNSAGKGLQKDARTRIKIYR